MKSLIVAIALLVSGTTFANVKPYGTPVADQCAQEVESQSGVSGVCFGHLTGMRQAVLMISVKNNNGRVMPYVLPIVSIEPGNTGITGEHKGIIVILAEDDMRFVVHGTGSPGQVETLTGDMFGYDFHASNFDFVLHTL